MKLSRKQKVILFTGIALSLSMIALLVYSITWFEKRRRNAEIIRNAILQPQTIDPNKFLNSIDKSFRSLPAERKRSILKDRQLLKKYVADATRKELSKSFKVLFCLPEPARKKIIKHSAERLLTMARENPERVNAAFASPAGHGALRGASNFFLLNLSGKEKAELAPLTAAMYEVVRQQSKGIKLKEHKTQ